MPTLDQLQVFLTVVEQGSFSAAARKLRRVQSAVSHAMANLEQELGLSLWDRATRVPRLTAEGRALVEHARRVCDDVNALEQLARGFAGGLESSLSLSVDSTFPLAALVDLARELGRAYPSVELRLSTDTMSDVAARVIDGSADLGVVGPHVETPGLVRSHVTYVRMVPVAAREHPLARVRGAISEKKLREHVQIVLSERGEARASDRAVLSMRTYRVHDLHTKLELLRGGLGFGNMPEHMVRADLSRGKLVRIAPESWGEDEHLLSLALVHRPSLRMGPATSWVVRRIRELCTRETTPRRKPS